MSYSRLVQRFETICNTPVVSEESGDFYREYKTWSEKLALIARMIPSVCLSAQEAQELTNKLTKWHRSNKFNWASALLDDQAAKAEQAAYAKVQDALLYQAINPFKSDPKVIADSLVKYAKNNEIIEFANLFAANDPIMDDAGKKVIKDALEKLLENPEQLPDPHWVRRALDDPKWIVSLSLTMDIQASHYLDLTGCSRDTIYKVVTAHAKIPEIKVALDCSQEDLFYILESGWLRNVDHLDLHQCRDLDRSKMESYFSGIGPWRTVRIPDNIRPGVYELGWRYLRVYYTFDDVSNILRGRPCERLPSSQMAKPVFNALLQTGKDHLKNIPFPCHLNFGAFNLITADLICELQLPKGPITLKLAYCPNIDKKGLNQIFEKLNVEFLSLYGCSYINDSLLENHPLLTQKGKFGTLYLELRGTSISCDMVEKIKAAQPGIKIEHDPDFIPNHTRVDRHLISLEDLSLEAKRAIYEFKLTGYMPLITVEVACELLSKPQHIINNDKARLLIGYCADYLACNLTKDNALKIYKVAKANDLNLHLLIGISMEFIRTFCNPEVPAIWSQIPSQDQIEIKKILNEYQPQFGLFNHGFYGHREVPEQPSTPLLQDSDIAKKMKAMETRLDKLFEL